MPIPGSPGPLAPARSQRSAGRRGVDEAAAVDAAQAAVVIAEADPSLPPLADGRSTRERILDAAEIVFAREGYFAATIRDITRCAGVELSLARYHFGSKDGLFQAVLGRCATNICSALDEALNQALAGGAPVELQSVVEAFVSPATQRLAAENPAWRRYLQLTSGIGVLMDRPDLVAPFRDPYMATTLRFRAALRAALPQASDTALDAGLHIMGVLVGHAMLELSLTRFLSGGVIGAFDWVEWQRQLVRHVTGGLRAQAEA